MEKEVRGLMITVLLKRIKIDLDFFLVYFGCDLFERKKTTLVFSECSCDVELRTREESHFLNFFFN